MRCISRQHNGLALLLNGFGFTMRAALRAALYMAALSARRNNPVLRAFADRLEAKGLKGKQVIVAVMRKLIHLAYGILKSSRPFEINYGQSVAIAA